MYTTGNSIQYAIMAYMGKEPKKEWIHDIQNRFTLLYNLKLIVFINYIPINIKNKEKKYIVIKYLFIKGKED